MDASADLSRVYSSKSVFLERWGLDYEFQSVVEAIFWLISSVLEQISLRRTSFEYRGLIWEIIRWCRGALYVVSHTNELWWTLVVGLSAMHLLIGSASASIVVIPPARNLIGRQEDAEARCGRDVGRRFHSSAGGGTYGNELRSRVVIFVQKPDRFKT